MHGNLKKTVMRCHDREGTCREIQLGAYQTDFKTNGFQRFDLVYLGKGTADEYKDIDVKESWFLSRSIREKNGGSIFRFIRLI